MSIFSISKQGLLEIQGFYVASSKLRSIVSASFAGNGVESSYLRLGSERKEIALVALLDLIFDVDTTLQLHLLQGLHEGHQVLVAGVDKGFESCFGLANDCLSNGSLCRGLAGTVTGATSLLAVAVRRVQVASDLVLDSGL